MILVLPTPRLTGHYDTTCTKHGYLGHNTTAAYGAERAFEEHECDEPIYSVTRDGFGGFEVAEWLDDCTQRVVGRRSSPAYAARLAQRDALAHSSPLSEGRVLA